jgi:RNA polymerase sigma factor (sigma-70 family)
MDLDNVSDQDILRRIQAGHADAFDILVTRYRRLVYVQIRRLARWSIPEEDWFDIEQEVWLSIWNWIKDRAELKGDSLGGLVSLCAHQKTVDALRKINARRKHVVNSQELVAEAVEPSANTTHAIEASNEVDALLSGLDPEKKTIVWMYQAGGMTLDEIAAEMLCSRTRVFRLLSQAMEALYKKRGQCEF